jgi:formylglycine-generating enzyme required for sulfatase activity
MCAVQRSLACALTIALFWSVAEAAFAQEAKKEASLQESIKANAPQTALDLGKGVKLELVLIRPGSFMMGDGTGGDDEKPVHKVTLTKPFYIGKYKVTQPQWEALMGSNPSIAKDPKNPVERVSWEDCKAFLQKLDAKFGDKVVKFSFPTEAQWEYACRAGKTTKYCFGDKEADLGRYAWFIENSKDKIHPVGEKKPNAWGLYDVHGDAWEWCADWYDKAYYKTSPANDPPGPASGIFRVCRGSSWESMAPDCRCGFRLFAVPSDRFPYISLRVACGW